MIGQTFCNGELQIVQMSHKANLLTKFVTVSIKYFRIKGGPTKIHRSFKLDHPLLELSTIMYIFYIKRSVV